MRREVQDIRYQNSLILLTTYRINIEVRIDLNSRLEFNIGVGVEVEVRQDQDVSRGSQVGIKIDI